MNGHTDRMPGFLLDHLHRNGWRGFREVQERSFDVLFDSDDHLLICSGTSSGKTEAAMIPVISSLYSDPPDGIGALYVGPTKALIDDQFARIASMLKDSYIPVQGWHGDVDQYKKLRLMDDPRGIVQITPESLEGILDNHPESVARMFSELRFVVIDEVHSFIASDRGIQLLCLLERLERSSGCRPRRIGLSATLSNPEDAAGWLTANTDRRTSIVSNDDRRSCRIGIKHCRFPPKDDKDSRKRAVNAYYSELFRLTDPYSCIVFTNSRGSAERTGRSLAKVSAAKGSRNPVQVHHGSLSGDVRKSAEENLRSDSNATVVATVTLELGVDIGNLDRVVQIGAPYSVSSLVQRMGRSGRRGGSQELVMFCNDDDGEWRPGIPGVSLELARGIAETELYLGEGWTEPLTPEPLPYGILFHQTLAALKSAQHDVRFTDLCNDVLSLYPFSGISKDDYRLLLKHMINQQALIQTEDLSLVIGPKAEPVAFGREFQSVFVTRKETEIRANGTVIGTVAGEPGPGAVVALAGSVWMIVKRGDGWADAVETDGEADNMWKSEAPIIDTKVMRKILEVLTSDKDYPYLDSAARTELGTSRKEFAISGAWDVFVPDDDGYAVYPWLGTVQFDTLRRMLARVTDVTYSFDPLVIGIATDMTPDEIVAELKAYKESHDISSLIDDQDLKGKGKYDRFVPETLKADEFASRRLDWDFEL